jgi:hypothetical protein
VRGGLRVGEDSGAFGRVRVAAVVEVANAAVPRSREFVVGRLSSAGTVSVVAVPEHVRRLRSRVGNDLLLLPSVSVLVIDGTRLLLVRHSGLGGQWGVVGGAVEVGESPADAAIREAAEEIGVEVELVQLVGVLRPGLRGDSPQRRPRGVRHGGLHRPDCTWHAGRRRRRGERSPMVRTGRPCAQPGRVGAAYCH